MTTSPALIYMSIKHIYLIISYTSYWIIYKFYVDTKQKYFSIINWYYNQMWRIPMNVISKRIFILVWYQQYNKIYQKIIHIRLFWTTIINIIPTFTLFHDLCYFIGIWILTNCTILASFHVKSIQLTTIWNNIHFNNF